MPKRAVLYPLLPVLCSGCRVSKHLRQALRLLRRYWRSQQGTIPVQALPCKWSALPVCWGKSELFSSDIPACMDTLQTLAERKMLLEQTPAFWSSYVWGTFLILGTVQTTMSASDPLKERHQEQALPCALLHRLCFWECRRSARREAWGCNKDCPSLYVCRGQGRGARIWGRWGSVMHPCTLLAAGCAHHCYQVLFCHPQTPKPLPL